LGKGTGAYQIEIVFPPSTNVLAEKIAMEKNLTFIRNTEVFCLTWNNYECVNANFPRINVFSLAVGLGWQYAQWLWLS